MSESRREREARLARWKAYDSLIRGREEWVRQRLLRRIPEGASEIVASLRANPELWRCDGSCLEHSSGFSLRVDRGWRGVRSLQGPVSRIRPFHIWDRWRIWGAYRHWSARHEGSKVVGEREPAAAEWEARP